MPPHSPTTCTLRELARLFLALNGHALTFDPQDATRIVLALAAGELSEEELTDWFRDHLA